MDPIIKAISETISEDPDVLAEIDTTEEIEEILGKAEKGEDAWISQIVGKKEPTMKSKLEKLKPKPKATPKPPPPKLKPAKKAPEEVPAKPSKAPKRDKDYEKYIEWKYKSSPAARLFDHQLSMALGYVDSKTDEIFDNVQDATDRDPPEGCEGEDAVHMRNFSELEFRSELRKLLRKYDPAPPTAEPTAWR